MGLLRMKEGDPQMLVKPRVAILHAEKHWKCQYELFDTHADLFTFKQGLSYAELIVYNATERRHEILSVILNPSPSVRQMKIRRYLPEQEFDVEIND